MLRTLRTSVFMGAAWAGLALASPATAGSCFGIGQADLELSRRTIATACDRDPDECYGEARRWQNIVRYFENRVCEDTDRASLAAHNAWVRRLVAGLGRDSRRISRYKEAVRQNDLPRGATPQQAEAFRKSNCALANGGYYSPGYMACVGH